jgi:hypothetical protein
LIVVLTFVFLILILFLKQVASSNPQSRSPMLFASMSSASMNSMYGLPPFKDSQRPPYGKWLFWILVFRNDF